MPSDERQLLGTLAGHLRAEREVVVYLLFKLTVVKLLLSADDARFVPDVVHEVDQTLAELRQWETRRDATVHELAVTWQAEPATLTLAAIAQRAGTPFDVMFEDYQRAFTALAADIEDVGRDNRALAKSRWQQVAMVLDTIAGNELPVATYDRRGEFGSSGATQTARRQQLL